MKKNKEMKKEVWRSECCRNAMLRFKYSTKGSLYKDYFFLLTNKAMNAVKHGLLMQNFQRLFHI
jgi:hypothetical protein